MFGFNIFNNIHWIRISHARTFGFVGFVFCALIFASLPIYIATCTYIIRKKKPLITIKIPKLIKHKQSQEPVKTEQPAPEPEPKDDIPDNIPLEIRPAFIQAKNHPLPITIEQPNTPTDENETDNTPLPLPADFDISIDTPNKTEPPMFKDLDFYTEDKKSPENQNKNSDLISYLNKKNIPFETQDDIIITDTQAIITHNDSDFWVTDNENWFATGKTKTSPALIIKSVAKQHNVTPVLYLAQTNIMDIETLIPQWESDGITVITDINKL